MPSFTQALNQTGLFFLPRLYKIGMALIFPEIGVIVTRAAE